MKSKSKSKPVLHGIKAVSALRKAAKRAQKHATGDNFFDGPDGLDEKGNVRLNHCYRRDEYALLLRTSFELEKGRERHIGQKKKKHDREAGETATVEAAENDTHHDAVAGSHVELVEVLEGAGLILCYQRVHSRQFRATHHETLVLVSATHQRLQTELELMNVEKWLNGGSTPAAAPDPAHKFTGAERIVLIHHALNQVEMAAWYLKDDDVPVQIPRPSSD